MSPIPSRVFAGPPKAPDFAITRPVAAAFRCKARCGASARWGCPRSGPRSGFVGTLAALSRPPGGTRAAASSAAIMMIGGKYVIRINSSGLWSSHAYYRPFVRAFKGTWANAERRARQICAAPLRASPLASATRPPSVESATFTPKLSPASLRDHCQRLDVRELDSVGRACPKRSAPCCDCSSVGSLPGAGVERPKGGVMFPQPEQVVRRTSLIDWNLSEPLALEAAGV